MSLESSQAQQEPDDECDPVTELVVRALHRLESEGEVGLERFCDEHPEHCGEIRARVVSLQSVGLLGPAIPADLPTPKRIGDFELIERIGSGGMGVVYRARQTPLDREVALKLVRPEHLYFPGTRARFRREIQVVARLRHESIVQLFSVGEDDGMPWFAMEHVIGADLGAVLTHLAGREPQGLSGEDLRAAVQAIAGVDTQAQDGALPRLFEGSWVRVCARIAERVAEALAHAHAHGILHRDLKPSNVMVTPDGRVVLMDFGLASDGDAERITRTGGLLGSLPYMAPEQIGVETLSGVDERTDVYSLGVTLYELLSLRPAFEGKSSGSILGKIRDGLPRRLSRLNPAVPWDAETVCATALAREPERRYPSASAFARDLRSFLDLRPIAAKRANLWLRTRRWMQRHPAMGGATLVVLLCVVLVPLVLWSRERTAREQLQAVDDARRREYERAHTNLMLANSAVKQMLLRLSSDQSTDDSDTLQMQAQLLDDAAGFLEQLLVGNLEDPELRVDQAETLIRAAEARRAMRDLNSARHYYERASAIVADPGAEVSLRREIAALAARMGLASTEKQDARRGAADRGWRDSEARARDLFGRFPNSVDVQRALATCLQERALLQSSASDFVGSAALRHEALGLRETLAAGNTPSDAQVDDWLELGDCHAEAYALARQRGQHDEAAKSASRLLESFETASRRASADVRPRRRLATWHAILGSHALGDRDYTKAAELSARSLAEYGELAELLPRNFEIKRLAGAQAANVATALSRLGRDEEALQILLAAAQRLCLVTELWPNEARAYSAALVIGERLVTLLDQFARTNEADAALFRCEEHVSKLRGAAPELATTHSACARVHALAARRLAARGEWLTARVRIEAALSEQKTAQDLGVAQRVTIESPAALEALRDDYTRKEAELERNR